MPVTGASGSKSNPGGRSGNAAGQSSGRSSGGGGGSRGGNVNRQGGAQGRKGSLGTTKAQVNAGMLGQRINSPLTNPFSRARDSLGKGHVRRASAAAIAAGGIAGMISGRKGRGNPGPAGGLKAVLGRLQSHQANEIESR